MSFFSPSFTSATRTVTFTAPTPPAGPAPTEVFTGGSSTSGDGHFSVTVNGQPATGAPLIGHAPLFPTFHF